ncbi:MAG: hypothetical protein TEF_06585 [Rhizobiales bacterium NRL2]|jgi:hypothetical protein|nr:MAG: hypothetical protein TEF_06585 [Rhizobiales bacterium NRL2]
MNSNFGAFAYGRAALAVTAFALLAACSTSDTAVVSAGTEQEIANTRASEVAVINNLPRPLPELDAQLNSQMMATMPRCALGARSHRAEITVTDFKEANTAKALLIGDDMELSGRVRFVDLSTNKVTGEYFVEESFFWGGIVGAAMMSNAAAKLSRSFAETVCKDVFGVDLKPE